MKRRFGLVAILAISLVLPVPQAFAEHSEPVRAEHGIVASVDAIASQIGVDIMKRGGNAVDAGVAVGLALAVTWPNAGNLGGGGFMVIRLPDGSAEVIDYRERAPLAATADMYLDEEGELIEDASTVGALAAGIPGTVAGLALAIERHGNLTWAEVIEPARKLAAEGFPVSWQLAKRFNDDEYVELMSRFEESRRVFLRNGNPPKPGEIFVQKDLAATLERLKKEGPREFYEGKTAKLIVAEMVRSGGIITLEDLRKYDPTIREPLRGRYRGYEILTMPPPSSGGAVLLQMLNVLEPFDLGEMGHNASAYLHLLVEVMKRAFADRAEHMGDTDFVDVPLEWLISEARAEEVRKSLDLGRAIPSSEIGPSEPMPVEPESTTHYSIVDRDGMMVSNTYTINGTFGSGLTVRGAGFLLNNEMDDFSAKVGEPNMYGLIQGEANAIEPWKRPLSSMTPTIVVKDGEPFMAIGSPGGPRIINTVLQVILNVIDHGMDVQEAVSVP
ncbi:MAG: gamma-glutamyltransferase, partial [Thermoanaerobaculia bacterium]|nr:gamma-glutamyltransferase [Thermoanaerobaculia bacterium]